MVINRFVTNSSLNLPLLLFIEGFVNHFLIIVHFFFCICDQMTIFVIVYVDGIIVTSDNGDAISYIIFLYQMSCHFSLFFEGI